MPISDAACRVVLNSNMSQVWYLIVSIPDLCNLITLHSDAKQNSGLQSDANQ